MTDVIIATGVGFLVGCIAGAFVALLAAASTTDRFDSVK